MFVCLYFTVKYYLTSTDDVSVVWEVVGQSSRGKILQKWGVIRITTVELLKIDEIQEQLGGAAADGLLRAQVIRWYWALLRYYYCQTSPLITNLNTRKKYR